MIFFSMKHIQFFCVVSEMNVESLYSPWQGQRPTVDPQVLRGAVTGALRANYHIGHTYVYIYA